MKTIIDKYVRARDVSQKSAVCLCFVDLHMAFDSEKDYFIQNLHMVFEEIVMFLIIIMCKKASFCLKLNGGITPMLSI